MKNLKEKINEGKSTMKGKLESIDKKKVLKCGLIGLGVAAVTVLCKKSINISEEDLNELPEENLNELPEENLNELPEENLNELPEENLN